MAASSVGEVELVLLVAIKQLIPEIGVERCFVKFELLVHRGIACRLRLRNQLVDEIIGIQSTTDHELVISSLSTSPAAAKLHAEIIVAHIGYLSHDVLSVLDVTILSIALGEHTLSNDIVHGVLGELKIAQKGLGTVSLQRRAVLFKILHLLQFAHVQVALSLTTFIKVVITLLVVRRMQGVLIKEFHHLSLSRLGVDHKEEPAQAVDLHNLHNIKLRVQFLLGVGEKLESSAGLLFALTEQVFHEPILPDVPWPVTGLEGLARLDVIEHFIADLGVLLFVSVALVIDDGAFLGLVILIVDGVEALSHGVIQVEAVEVGHDVTYHPAEEGEESSKCSQHGVDGLSAEFPMLGLDVSSQDYLEARSLAWPSEVNICVFVFNFTMLQISFEEVHFENIVFHEGSLVDPAVFDGNVLVHQLVVLVVT